MSHARSCLRLARPQLRDADTVMFSALARLRLARQPLRDADWSVPSEPNRLRPPQRPMRDTGSVGPMSAPERTPCVSQAESCILRGLGCVSHGR